MSINIAAGTLTVTSDAFERLNVNTGTDPSGPATLREKLEGLLGYRFIVKPSVNKGVAQTTISLETNRKTESISIPQNEALELLHSILKTEIEVLPEIKQEFIKTERERIIQHLHTRYAAYNASVVVNGNFGFKIESCSDTKARELLLGEIKEWEASVKTKSGGLAQSLPLSVAAIASVFENGSFRKYKSDVEKAWSLPVNIQNVVQKPLEPLQAAAYFLPENGGALLMRYIASVQNGSPVTAGLGVAEAALAIKEFEAWQEYLAVFKRFGFDIRIAHLPRHREALKDVANLPAFIAEKENALVQINVEIERLTAEKSKLERKDQKPIEQQIRALEKKRSEEIVGAQLRTHVALSHESVINLRTSEMPLGKLAFPCLLVSQTNASQFSSEEANQRLRSALSVLEDLIERKATLSTENLTALKAYQSDIEQHAQTVSELTRVEKDPSLLKTLNGDVQKRVRALQERVQRYESGKTRKTGKALEVYLASTIDPRLPPAEPRWNTIPVDGNSGVETKLKRAFDRLRDKTNTANTAAVEEARFSTRSLQDWQAELEAREAKHFDFTWISFSGAMIVRTILGNRESNLRELGRLCRVDGLRSLKSQDGLHVSVGIPVSTKPDKVSLIQLSLQAMAVRAEALAPAHMLKGDQEKPIFDHTVVGEIVRELEAGRAQTRLSPAELVRAAVTEVGERPVKQAPIPSTPSLFFTNDTLASILSNQPEHIQRALKDWQKELGVISLRVSNVSAGYNLELSPLPDPDSIERARFVLTYLQTVLAERTFIAPNDVEQARIAARDAFTRVRPGMRMHKGKPVHEVQAERISAPNIDKISYITSTADAGFMEARVVMTRSVPAYCGKESSFLHYLAAHDAWTAFEAHENLRGVNIRTDGNTIIFNGTTPTRIKQAVDYFERYVQIVEEHKGHSVYALSTLLQVALGKHTLPDPNSVAALRGITTPEVLRNVVPNSVVPLTDNQRAYAYALEHYPAVIVVGRAGTGKNFIASHESAQAQCRGDVEQILWSNFMSRQAVSLGALPGNFFDKLQFLYGPFIENYVDAIIGHGVDKKKALGIVDKLMRDSGLDMPGFNSIDILDPRFAMGRTLRNAKVYIDEAQLMPKNYIEVLIQRIGEGSWLRIMGSLEQIIDPGIFGRDFKDPEGCGLAFALYAAIHNPKIRSMTAIVFLDAPEDVRRSDLAAVWGDAFHEINTKEGLAPRWRAGLLEDVMPHVLRYDKETGLVLPAREIEARKSGVAILPTATGTGGEIAALPMMQSRSGTNSTKLAIGDG